MINLSQVLMSRQDVPTSTKLYYLRHPYYYLAENMGDYLGNRDEIEFPWYKRSIIPFPAFLDKRAHVLIHNVRLRISLGNDPENPLFFDVSDSTGHEVMYWGSEDSTYPTGYTFEELCEEQDFKNNDWVSDLLIVYYIKDKFPVIGWVNKNKHYGRGCKRRKSLLELLKFPEPSPLPQTV